jgi:hypothetical protein
VPPKIEINSIKYTPQRVQSCDPQTTPQQSVVYLICTCYLIGTRNILQEILSTDLHLWYKLQH